MPTNRVLAKQEVATYTQCLLSAAQEEDRVLEDVEELRRAYQAVMRSYELREFLQDSNVEEKSKSALIKDILTGFSPEVVGVVATMAGRGDIMLLGRVAAAYEDAAEEALDAVVVDVTTAVPLDDHLRDVISKKFSADLGHAVRLNEIVDPSILGGFIASTHGKRMDASIRTRISDARVVLAQDSTGGEE